VDKFVLEKFEWREFDEFFPPVGMDGPADGKDNVTNARKVTNESHLLFILFLLCAM